MSSTVSLGLTTPSATEGESATETDGPDTESDSGTENESRRFVGRKKARGNSSTSFGSVSACGAEISPRDNPPVSQHDLFNRYFRKDVVLLHNLDPLRYVFLPME